MPTIRKRNILAAGEIVNVLSGDQYEFLPFNALVEFAIISNLGDDLATVYSGSDVLQQQGPISEQLTPPRYPDDFLLSDVAAAGERLNAQVQCVTGPSTIDTVVKITPL
jgi:hypothetical protein